MNCRWSPDSSLKLRTILARISLAENILCKIMPPSSSPLPKMGSCQWALKLIITFMLGVQKNSDLKPRKLSPPQKQKILKMLYARYALYNVHVFVQCLPFGVARQQTLSPVVSLYESTALTSDLENSGTHKTRTTNKHG